MNLNKLFNPKSVAIIGASKKENSVGQGLVVNILKGGTFHTEHNKPFKGKIFLINPKQDYILGHKCYDNILEIKEKIDLAIIAVPAIHVPKTVRECIAKKVKAIIIISAGFSESGDIGKELQDDIKEQAIKFKISLLGPNCLGMINTSHKLNASFAPAMPPKGDIAFISQSGALADSIIDWAIGSNYGFSKIISYGNAAIIEIPELINYLSKDPETKAIAIYLEGTDRGKELMQAAKKCKKPIIVLKGGKTSKSKKAVSSHTGSLAGNYEIYKTAFEQSNIKIANNVEELFELSHLLAHQKQKKGKKIAIVTNGGGCGVLTADAIIKQGLELAILKKSSIKKLDNSKLMHPAYSRNNPLDIIGDAKPKQYEIALNTFLAQPNVSGLIVVQTLQTMTDPIKNARIIVKAKKRYNKPIVCVFMGKKFIKESVEYLKLNNIPVYPFPYKAALAMKHLLN